MSDHAPPTRLALAGRVVTMDAAFRVHDHGVVYIDEGRIAAVTPADDAPAGFGPPTETGGTIYPGLIELHNHLAYNALPFYEVTQRYDDRSQWNHGDHYRRYVTGPMKVLANTRDYVLAIPRYAECKCLFGGTTTSQGISLSAYSGIARYFRGVVRNVEKTYDANLPDASTHISDVAATDRDAFLEDLMKQTCHLLHLAEGLNEAAHETFTSLQFSDKTWAITRALTGIHSAALERADFDVLAEKGAAMVWSPLSNLLLYGGTARIDQAKAAGVRIGIGSDWAPTGSKNLLAELKIARAVSQNLGGVLDVRDLVVAATREAAAILKWEAQLGAIERGKRADLVVVNGRGADSYEHLVGASERDLDLVMIDGVARHGRITLMRMLLGDAAADAERVTLGRSDRLIYLRQKAADPDVGNLTLTEARRRLEDGLDRLPELAAALQARSALAMIDAGVADELGPFLVLDHDEQPGFDLRPHFDEAEELTLARREVALAAATPLPELLVPLSPDPLSVASDDDYVTHLKSNINLPDWLVAQLDDLF